MTILKDEEVENLTDILYSKSDIEPDAMPIIISHRSLAAKNAELGKRVAELERTLKWEESRASFLKQIIR